jgi:hypothetical protein
MVACTSEEGDAGWGIGLVSFEVQEYTDCTDGDAFDEVDVEMVGLWAI